MIKRNFGQHLSDRSSQNSRICSKILGCLVFLALSLLPTDAAQAQQVAVKTNLLYDATATVNAGVEVGLARRWTLDASGNFMAWNMSHGRRWKHWLLQPEARYWFCHRFVGHFLGFHLHGGQFNVCNLDNDIKFLGTDFSKISDYRYQGWFAGGGVGYGYSWILGRHWNLEAEAGFGYSYTRYDKFPCATCGRKLEEDRTHHYVGVTKAAVNLIYSF